MDNMNNSQDGWIIKPDGWEYFELSTKDNLHTKSDNYKLIDLLDSQHQVIFVLAGGLEKDGSIYPWVKKRLDLAMYLYHKSPQPIICLGGGTYHKPPYINKHGFAVHESTACCHYLLKNNIPPNHLWKGWFSYDTIANGYFAFTNYIIPLNLDNILVITSEFHMERSKYIFEWIKELYTSQNKKNQNVKINYIATNNDGMNEKLVSFRRNREKNSLRNLKKLSKKITTLPEFHNWFHTEHNAYNCSIKKKKDPTITKQCIDSY